MFLRAVTAIAVLLSAALDLREARAATAPAPVFAVADNVNNFVDVYDQANFKLVLRLRGFLDVSGVAYDATGRLYVSDRDAGRVFVFAPGQVRPERFLADYAKFPSDVAVGADGRAYVANAINNITPAGVAVFGTRDVLPEQILTGPALTADTFVSVNNLTLDGAGNVLLCYEYFGAAGVSFGLGEFPVANRKLRIITSNVGSFPAIRAYGSTLYVATANQFLVARAPYATITRKFTLTNTVTAQGFDFTSDGKTVLVSDANGASVRQYSVSGKLLRTLFTAGEPVSLAAWPIPKP
jgi:hypothetical protein